MKKNLVFLCLSLLLSTVAWGQRSVGLMKNQRAFHEPLFSVDTAFWCTSVDATGNPGDPLSSANLSSPVYFWVRLKASNPMALDLLEKMDNPVIIKWFRSTGYGTSPEWSTDTQDNDIATEKGSRLQRKREMLADAKAFTYSTWNRLSKLTRPGVYLVTLVFYDNSPLECRGAPCTYQIKIDK